MDPQVIIFVAQPMMQRMQGRGLCSAGCWWCIRRFSRGRSFFACDHKWCGCHLKFCRIEAEYPLD